MSELGKTIKQKRIKSGVTQVQLSNKLGLTSAQYISNIERGKCPVSLTQLLKIAKHLNASIKPFKNAAMRDYKAKLDRILK
jgi:transcriptional regulator with XRE-family HTH domain